MKRNILILSFVLVLALPPMVVQAQSPTVGYSPPPGLIDSIFHPKPNMICTLPVWIVAPIKAVLGWTGKNDPCQITVPTRDLDVIHQIPEQPNTPAARFRIQ